MLIADIGLPRASLPGPPDPPSSGNSGCRVKVSDLGFRIWDLGVQGLGLIIGFGI